MSEIMENPKSTADERIKAAMIKSDTILKIIDLSDNLDAPALRSAYNFIARQKKADENNEYVMLAESSLTPAQRRESDDQQSFERVIKQSAHNAVASNTNQSNKYKGMTRVVMFLWSMA